MPAIENVNRRGATYWWRRRVRFVGRLERPITIVTTVSLLTKDQSVARRRAVAMTGRSEVVRMSLYERIEQEGLTSEQVNHLFREEMVRYRNMLAHQLAVIEKDGEGNVTARFHQMLSIYAAFNGDFIANGFDDYMGIDYIGSFDKRFPSLDDEARANLYAMLSQAGDVPGNLLNEAKALLERLDIEPAADRIEIARQIMCGARLTAAATYDSPEVRAIEHSLALMNALGRAPPQTSMPPPISAPAPPNAWTASTIVPAPASTFSDSQNYYADLSPMQAVEKYMELKPKARGRDDAPVLNEGASPKRRKSQPKVWGASQKRQFKAAPFLFGKSNNGKALAATSQEDLNQFYDLLNRLPSSHHKSPRHEAMSLEEICSEALDRLTEEEERGEEISFAIGLDVGTINRHFANLKRLCAWLATKTPMAPLDFSDFILDEDDRDERDERDPYTIAQGEELFRLGIWTGGTGVDLPQRLSVTPGGSIWHDAAYWVMPLVWYSGMRREEACKLLVDDIGEEDGIFFVNIRKTSAGGVKNATSVRKIPICDELRRLGFLHYVQAMNEAGEQYLFPEIQPGRTGRALGDVFFKNVWLHIKQRLTLVKPGQAVHSGRHMVSTELKMLQTFEEFRSDLLGQKTGGENASRYASATRLQILFDIVNQIPKVTAHLPDAVEIRLLPVCMRGARPTRESAGRRKRG